MFFDQWLPWSPTAADGGGSDPTVANLAASLGIDLNNLTGAGASTSPPTQAELSSQLIQSAVATSGSYGSPLPWWVQGVKDQLVAQGQFDKVYKAGDGLVFFGQGGLTPTSSTPSNKFATDMGGSSETTTKAANKDYAVTVSAAQNLPYTWDEQEVADAMARLKDAGIQVDSFDMGSNSLVAVWGSLVNRAAMTYQQTDQKRKLTPWDVLDLYKSEAVASGALDPNRTTSTTYRTVTDITEGQAWSTLQNNLSQLLGRDPSDQEVRDFTYRMGRMAASNPSISKTVSQYKNGEVANVSTHTNPGFTEADLAQQAYDQAQNDPGYAEYRGASYLFNAAMSALGPIGG